MKDGKSKNIEFAKNIKFVIREWNIVNDQSNANYCVGNRVIYSTEVLRSNLCDYNDAYILVRRDITNIGGNCVTEIAFKNCAPYMNCFSKIDGTIIDDIEDLDLTIF